MESIHLKDEFIKLGQALKLALEILFPMTERHLR
mgnify:CR=1 FL=1